MRNILYVLFLNFFLTDTFGWTQKNIFTFADTYPTNNVDSLEQWLKTYRQPTAERLKNLIRLRRTYNFIYPERRQTYKDEIVQLSRRFNNPVGKLIDYKNINELQQSLEEFETQKDTSGIIYALILLTAMNYGHTLLARGDDYSAKEYLFRAKQLLKYRFNAHDYFMVTTYEFYNQSGKTNSDNSMILASLQEALYLCESRQEYQYAWFTIKSNIAITYHYLKDYATSYATNKEILSRFNPNQKFQIVTVTQNLATDCEFLGKYDERLALCHEIDKQIRSLPQNVYPYNYLNLYISFKEEMSRRGRYRKALDYCDSIMMIQDTIYSIERKQKLIEFQAENNQKKIDQLSHQQDQIEYRSRFILALLAISVLVAIILIYLGLRLRYSNTRLKALVEIRDEFIRIIAHDLRRPLHAFYGLSEVFNQLLQRGDQQSILQLSQSIDKSGLAIRQMLDNLLYWALAQKEQLVINRTTFELWPHFVTLQTLYGGTCTKLGIELLSTCPPDLAVHTDSNALDLILRNLLDNATQHTRPKGMVELVAEPIPTGGVQIKIIDTGRGMNPIQLTLVREMLKKPSSFHPKQQNLGLGLIIVGIFAQQVDISIRVNSEEGVGTIFWLKLPKGNR